MFKKKFLIILLMLFILTVGVVSAHEDANDTVVAYENPDIGEISSVDGGIGTADILADGESHARFNVSNDTKSFQISVLDDDGNYVKDGAISYIFEETGEGSYVELYDYDYTPNLNLYDYYDSLPSNLTFSYEGNYQVDDLTIYVDSLVDSIVASDVIDASTFSARFYDEYGDALSEVWVKFHVYNEDTNRYFEKWIGSDGIATLDLPLSIGNYTVDVGNSYTGQHKCYWWNITKLDESKFVNITVSQIANFLVVSAVNKEGINITEGTFTFISESFYYGSAYLYGNPFVTFSLMNFGFDSYPQNITIKFSSDKYFPANTTFYVDSLIDTIDVRDVVDEGTLSVTFYDNYGNVLTGEYVEFFIRNDDSSYMKNVYVRTDSNGVANVNLALMPDNYTVWCENSVTGQYKSCWWNITQKIPNKDSHINASFIGYDIVFNVLNDTGDVILYKTVYLYVNGEYCGKCYMDHNISKYNIYSLGEGNYDVTLIFKDGVNYYDSNMTLQISIRDTIKVNSSFYNTTTCTLQMLDYDGNPAENISVEFEFDGLIYRAVTDENGYLAFDFILEPGTYEIWVCNTNANQYKTFSMEIIEEYPDRKAEIHVSRDGYQLTVNVTDVNGSIINDGIITVKGDDYSKISYNIINGSVNLNYFDLYWAEYEGDVNLTFIFNNHNYYPANTTYSFTVVDTIILDDDIQKGSIFNATFLDMDGKPLIYGEVNFLVYQDGGNIVIANLTTQTDESGFAYIKIDDKYFKADVILTNLVTYQYESGYWDARKTLEITPVAEIVDESTIYLPSGTETLVFELSPEATDYVFFSDSIDYASDYREIVDGTVSVNVTDGNYLLYLYYPGDSNFSSLEKTYTLIVGSLYDSVMTVSENITADYMDDVNFTVNLKYEDSPISGASIEIVIGNNTYDGVTDKNGNYTIPIALDAGNYDVSVIYKGNITYSPANKTTTLTINKINTQINVNESVIDYGSELIVTVEGNATGQIIVEIDKNKFNGTISDNIASIDLSDLAKGTYDAVISYSGDNNYNNNSITSKITINPLTLNINVSADLITAGENASVVVTGLENATGDVSVAVNGETYTAPIEDGKATVIVLGLTENATALISYAGDDKYNNASATVVIVVNPKEKENATITIDAPEVTEGENATVTVTLPEDAAGNVTVGNVTVPVVNGTATVIIADLPVGNTTLPVTYSGDDKYNPMETEVNITVKEDTSDIVSAPDVTKYYKGPERFVVNVTDYQGNPLANKTVIININGKDYTRSTDANGTASMALGLPSNTYNVTVTVDNRTVNSVVTILSTVNGTDVVKMYRNGTQYYATFLDTDGKYLANGTDVQFNINGVMYNRKVSGDKGLAKLNINLPVGEYIITAMNPETGENTADNITVLAIIVENRDITKYYKNDTQYTVKVLGADGKVVGAGETVKFNINGIFYERTTNESGIVKLSINLPPGDYIITAEYRECKVANNIKVLPVLSAEDLTMKYHGGNEFVATLLDGQGKPYADQKLQFNINGVLYYRVTDSSGQAKLKINLIAGQYIITSSFNGANIANKVTIFG